jgi:hypothetical protein
LIVGKFFGVRQRSDASIVLAATRCDRLAGALRGLIRATRRTSWQFLPKEKF